MMDDFDALPESEKREYIMIDFREHYPLVTEVIARLILTQNFKITEEEFVAIIKGLSLACIEYINYVEENDMHNRELH